MCFFKKNCKFVFFYNRFKLSFIFFYFLNNFSFDDFDYKNNLNLYKDDLNNILNSSKEDLRYFLEKKIFLLNFKYNIELDFFILKFNKFNDKLFHNNINKEIKERINDIDFIFKDINNIEFINDYEKSLFLKNVEDKKNDFKFFINKYYDFNKENRFKFESEKKIYLLVLLNIENNLLSLLKKNCNSFSYKSDLHIREKIYEYQSNKRSINFMEILVILFFN